MLKKPSSLINWFIRAHQELAGQRVLYAGIELPEAAVDEAFARAMLKAVADPEHFTSYRHLVNWTKLAGYRLAVDAFRLQAGRPRELSSPDWFDAADPGSCDDSSNRWSAEDRLSVREALELLPRVQREVLEGWIDDELTDLELAARLYRVESPTKAMGLRIFRLRRKALLQLQTLLEKRGIGSRS